MVNSGFDAFAVTVKAINVRSTIQVNLAIPLAVDLGVQVLPRADAEAARFRLPINVAEQLRGYALALERFTSPGVECRLWFLRLRQRLKLGSVGIVVKLRVKRHKAQPRYVFTALVNLNAGQIADVLLYCAKTPRVL